MRPSPYKVGDLVYVRELETGSHYYSPYDDANKMGYTSEMQKLAGPEKYKIKNVMPQEFGYTYHLVGESWTWTEEFLISASRPKSNLEAKKFLSLEE